jgi:hypothetical protein
VIAEGIKLDEDAKWLDSTRIMMTVRMCLVWWSSECSATRGFRPPTGFQSASMFLYFLNTFLNKYKYCSMSF